MPFRLQRKDFFLTYPQSNLDINQLYDFFNKERNIQYYCIGKEHHQDGGIHFHVYAYYDRLKDVRNERYFDLDNEHPNIRLQPTKSILETINYCKKEGFQVLEYGDEPQEVPDDIYILAATMERNEFFNYCRKKRIAYQYAKDAWDTSQTVTNTIKEGDEIVGTVSPEFDQYEPKLPLKATVIVGGTGIGKTTWAIRNATKPTLFCSHIDDLKEFRAQYHRSIIFDDMSFKHWHLQAQIHISDLERKRSVNVKHTIVGIPQGVERWFTCNEYPFTECDFGAIRRRIHLINLY